MKVLIVDDEMVIRLGISSLIDWAACGYELIGEASNGRRALELIRAERPDLVLTDIKMPEMDGIELIQEIRRTDPAMGILVLSSYSDFELVKDAMKLGANEYLLKLKLTRESLVNALNGVREEVAARRGGQRESGARSGTQISEKAMLADMLSEIDELKGVPSKFRTQHKPAFSNYVAVYARLSRPEEGLTASGEAMERIVEELFNEHFVSYCIQMDDFAFAVILLSGENEPGRLKELLHETARRCVHVLYDLTNVRTVMAIGTVEPVFSSLRESLQSAVAALDRLMVEEAVNVEVIESEGVAGDSVLSGLPLRDGPDGRMEGRLRTGGYPQSVKLAMNYIQEHFRSDLTLNEVAGAVNLNSSYFSSLFNSATSLTFVGYLTRVRLEHAKALLRETNLRIYEIAERAGYKNSYYFNRIFKKNMGITPLEYRKADGGDS